MLIGPSYLWSRVNQILSLVIVGSLAVDPQKCLVPDKSIRSAQALKWILFQQIRNILSLVKGHKNVLYISSWNV